MHLLDARRPDAAPRWNAIVEMHAVERQAGIAANLHGGVP
jgi:hypothetical protein